MSRMSFLTRVKFGFRGQVAQQFLPEEETIHSGDPEALCKEDFGERGSDVPAHSSD